MRFLDVGFLNLYPYTDFHEMNLDWCINTVKTLIKAVSDIDGWIENHEEEYKQLKDLYDAVMSGNFPDPIKQAFSSWMQQNALDIIGQMATTVFFGLTDSGYFVAYIPEGWDDVTFNTSGLDTADPGVGYGHLILSY